VKPSLTTFHRGSGVCGNQTSLCSRPDSLTSGTEKMARTERATVSSSRIKDSGGDAAWGHANDVPPSVWWQEGSTADRLDAWRNANAWIGTEEIQAEPSANPPVPYQPENPDCALYRVASMNVQDPALDPGPSNPSTRTMRGDLARALRTVSWQSGIHRMVDTEDSRLRWAHTRPSHHGYLAGAQPSERVHGMEPPG